MASTPNTNDKDVDSKRATPGVHSFQHDPYNTPHPPTPTMTFAQKAATSGSFVLECVPLVLPSPSAPGCTPVPPHQQRAPVSRYACPPPHLTLGGRTPAMNTSPKPHLANSLGSSQLALVGVDKDGVEFRPTSSEPSGSRYPSGTPMLRPMPPPSPPYTGDRPMVAPPAVSGRTSAGPMGHAPMAVATSLHSAQSAVPPPTQSASEDQSETWPGHWEAPPSSYAPHGPPSDASAVVPPSVPVSDMAGYGGDYAASYYASAMTSPDHYPHHMHGHTPHGVYPLPHPRRAAVWDTHMPTTAPAATIAPPHSQRATPQPTVPTAPADGTVCRDDQCEAAKGTAGYALPRGVPAAGMAEVRAPAGFPSRAVVSPTLAWSPEGHLPWHSLRYKHVTWPTSRVVLSETTQETKNIFIAQLPYDMPLTLLQTIFDRHVQPTATIFHLHAHVARKSKDGYVFANVVKSRVNDVARCLHGKILFGVQGYWYAASEEQQERLKAYCDRARRHPSSNDRHLLSPEISLPRCTLTVEVSKKDFQYPK